MNHPDIILLIDGDADRHAQQPFVRERLRPHRLNLELRSLSAGSLNHRFLVQNVGRDSEGGQNRQKRRTCIEISLHFFPSLTFLM